MKTAAAVALHEKALQILSVIEYAEERIEGKEKEIALFGFTPKNLKEEFDTWFMGKPSAREIEKTKAQKAAHEAAHARLCAYYGRILLRLIDLQ
jgi:hypothetical protein